jgi:hypothetical protein
VRLLSVIACRPSSELSLQKGRVTAALEGRGGSFAFGPTPLISAFLARPIDDWETEALDFAIF